MRRRLVEVVGLICAVAMVDACAVVSANAQALDVVPDCSAPFNPYSYTQEAVENCGLQTSVSRTQVSEPDGGAAFVYAFAGGTTTTIYQPPAGINWATASTTLLSDYGMPLPPPVSAGLVAIGNWQSMVEHLTNPAPAPPFLSVSPDVNDVSSAGDASSDNNSSDTMNNFNWSGYVAYPSSPVINTYVDLQSPT